jgi:hypothetical protein
LHERGIWSLTLREEHRLAVFENRVLRRILRHKKDEIIGENCIVWKFITYTPHQVRMVKSRKMRWAGHVTSVAKKRNAQMILIGKPQEKMPLGSLRHGCEDIIKMHLREIGWRYEPDSTGSR